MPWLRVQELARAGCDLEDITRALLLPAHVLGDAGVAERLRKVVEDGHAFRRCELRETIRTRGQRSSRRAGSVAVIALAARNELAWDRPLGEETPPPDLTTAKLRLRDLLARAAAARSAIEGRAVSSAEILVTEVLGELMPAPSGRPS